MELLPENIRRIHSKILQACEGDNCGDFIAACYVSAVKVIADSEDCSFLEAAQRFSNWVQKELIPNQEKLLKEKNMMQ